MYITKIVAFTFFNSYLKTNIAAFASAHVFIHYTCISVTFLLIKIYQVYQILISLFTYLERFQKAPKLYLLKLSFFLSLASVSKLLIAYKKLSDQSLF